MFIELFKKFLIHNPNIHKAYLVSEFQPWELAFVSASRSIPNGSIINTFIAHSNIRIWDLRYFIFKQQFRHASSIYFPEPDKIAVNSEYHYNLLSRFGYKINNLVRLEALRFLKYNKYRGMSTNLNDNRASNKVNILIAGDIFPSHTSSMLNIINSVASSNDQFNFYFRKHPASFMHNDAYFQFITDRSLDDFDELLKITDIMIVAPTTSMSMISLYINIPCICYLH